MNETILCNYLGICPDGRKDSTEGLQRAFNDGLGVLPAGRYRTTGTLRVPRGLAIRGAGRQKTTLVADHLGTALQSRSPVNSSTIVDIEVSRLGIECSHPESQGAGFEDNCGTYVVADRLLIRGFRYGIIFDQTELGDIDRCWVEFQQPGGAAIWLTGGDTRTPGAMTQLTNRISVAQCQINQNPWTYGIVDDGYIVHHYRENNFNGSLQAIRLAGAVAVGISNNEFEAQSGPPICLHYQTAFPSLTTGKPIVTGGAGCVVVESNSIAPYTTDWCIEAAVPDVPAAYDGLVLIGNLLAGKGPAAIGLDHMSSFFALGNRSGANTPPEYRGNPTQIFVADGGSVRATGVDLNNYGHTPVPLSAGLMNWLDPATLYRARRHVVNNLGSASGSLLDELVCGVTRWAVDPVGNARADGTITAEEGFRIGSGPVHINGRRDDGSAFSSLIAGLVQTGLFEDRTT